MRAAQVIIRHFRSIKEANILLPRHAVFIGDNNTGKTTVLEALDLTLGPGRLNRFPPIDEHDFYQGQYLAKEPDGKGQSEEDQVVEEQPAEADEGTAVGTEGVDAEPVEAPRIEVEVAIADLSEDQKARFGNYVEFWDAEADRFYDEPNPEGVDLEHITEALRVTFNGWYDSEEDDFQGKTYFTRSLNEVEYLMSSAKRIN